MKITIRHRWSDAVLFEGDFESMGKAVEAAVAKGADLACANLTRANLADADLACANLTRANLADAYLADANLTRAYLADANLTRAYLTRANLAGANLAGANLADANLAGANLAGANLTRAYLADANLTRAYLADANLTRAYLAGAKGIDPDFTTPLRILLDQPKDATLRAYKLVDKDYGSPMAPSRGYRRLVYTIGTEVEAKANEDATADCAAGVNIATLDWCLRNWQEGLKIMIVEFKREDLACVPDHSDGKFRVHRVKVIEEKQLDYQKLFPKKPEEKPQPVAAQGGGQTPQAEAQVQETQTSQT